MGYHYMIFYYMHTLQDVRIRKAIDLAIDRFALSQALWREAREHDESDAHGDKAEEDHLLEQAGLDTCQGRETTPSHSGGLPPSPRARHCRRPYRP
mmetsp:Transcript_17334/g.34849  ORF Transcript_17334/g.34849 Transcript_17334/m.34849 type:complete len:96 (-) Transcript_17334:211-498(-)